MGFCIDSIYGGQAVCIHNAATGREATMPHVIVKNADSPRNVVIVGAGPGGLEAARVAAERGHAVTVFEAASQAGGQVRLAATLRRRREIIGIIDWRLTQCERLGVQFRYESYAERSDVLALEPDIVVIATGGVPNTAFLDAGAELVTTSWDILSGSTRPAADVIVYDDNGAHPGMTLAEFVALAKPTRFELLTPERSLAPDVGGTSFPAYFKALSEADATITLNLRLERVRRARDGETTLIATFWDEYARRHVEKTAQQIIVEHGTLPVDELYFELKKDSINLGEVDQAALLAATPQRLVRNAAGRYRLFRIGDAVASRNIHAAVYDALRLLQAL